ncbi:MAG: bifunctional folylpolyglutamate synthase/dihydrofolate synthase [Syntrophomonadaceae bacterium]|nr:folylpolyglutamate synthase/dihydrofolate synthase family protein [Bacillota bacterium]NLP23452.1 bifunctional folylpolyglutamate synthase/dihydrofolate synthase [Syntrophomonadaceae bacterium]
MGKYGSRPGLQRITALLGMMGDPQQSIPCVHVAGTNGKGSTSLLIASILSCAGFRVGRFTSPHLHSYFERITINGQEIDGKDFNNYLDLTENAVERLLARGEEHPTEFEVLTAVAFHYFADQKVDIAVMETGLGGRFDSTNVIKPLLSVITSIDYDHTAVLGSTLEEIADNKAGIIKRQVPVIIGQLPEPALQVVQAWAADLEAPLYSSSLSRVTAGDLQTLTGQTVNIIAPGHSLDEVWFALPGAYQRENLACALTAVSILEEQGWQVFDEHIVEALLNARISGRLEMVCSHPMVLVDAAHNPQAARSMSMSLNDLLPNRKRVLVCGMVNDKDAWNTLPHLGKNTRSCIVTRPWGERGSDWFRVYETWQELFPEIPVQATENIVEAVEQGLQTLQDGEYLLITGSFYVLDQARRYFTDD